MSTSSCLLPFPTSIVPPLELNKLTLSLPVIEVRMQSCHANEYVISLSLSLRVRGLIPRIRGGNVSNEEGLASKSPFYALKLAEVCCLFCFSQSTCLYFSPPLRSPVNKCRLYPRQWVNHYSLDVRRLLMGWLCINCLQYFREWHASHGCAQCVIFWAFLPFQLCMYITHSFSFYQSIIYKRCWLQIRISKVVCPIPLIFFFLALWDIAKLSLPDEGSAKSTKLLANFPFFSCSHF